MFVISFSKYIKKPHNQQLSTDYGGVYNIYSDTDISKLYVSPG
jgi:hypothetical protein